VWTVGYSGHTPKSFIEAVRQSGVHRVVDVRSVPFSRKPGFSKRALSQALEAAGIGYIHMPELGASRELLARRKGGAPFAAIARDYKARLSNRRGALDALGDLLRDRPSALMCLEKDPSQCHRGILAATLARRGFRVVHL
jgi:uncharacterized protein (DUF488 family)